jgi:hypothetical protein
MVSVHSPDTVEKGNVPAPRVGVCENCLNPAFTTPEFPGPFLMRLDNCADGSIPMLPGHSTLACYAAVHLKCLLLRLGRKRGHDGRGAG